MNAVALNRRVLVVEDDRDVREAITEVLEDGAYEPVPAGNGLEAFQHLRTRGERPCLILLDIMMPVMDGWEFRAKQLQDPELSGIPVVVLTAHGNLEEATREMHVAAAIKKPIDLERLLTEVRRHCA